jgi:hypothetical protein
MWTTLETSLTLLLFCRNSKINDQRRLEEHEDHTNKRLLRKKCASTKHIAEKQATDKHTYTLTLQQRERQKKG